MDESASARYFSVDVNPQTTHIAQQIAAHAGLADRITYLVGAQGLGSPEVLSALQKAAPRGFDCVFIDHYKPCYLPDLRLLEKAGLLRVGTRVIGDNIIYPGAPEYLAYVQQSPCYKTELIQTQLEYSDQADAVTISDVVSTSFGTE
mmetsp:Transcript_5807/g.12821  ORF Transcript_5807/g.12821 Transcript_5807/m.12821 type:complete len:147 (+) Transcript_5807:1-441(+)